MNTTPASGLWGLDSIIGTSEKSSDHSGGHYEFDSNLAGQQVPLVNA